MVVKSVPTHVQPYPLLFPWYAFRRLTYLLLSTTQLAQSKFIMTVFTEAQSRLNLKEEARLILGMIHKTEEKYSAGYLIRLLKGDERFETKEESHQELEGYGAFPDAHSDRLRNMLRFFERRGLVYSQGGMYGILGLSDKGQAFINEPGDLWVSYRSLRRKPLQQKLMLELRDIRREWAGKEQKPPYQIFTDYMLERLIKDMPTTAQELAEIPGFGDYKVNRYGPALIQTISAAKAEAKKARQAEFERKVQNPSHQATRALFEAGYSEEAIAAKRKIKTTTVRQQLINLHRSGQIDLNPWIEQTLSAELLTKGSNYFQESENARLKTAYEALGMDYDVLRLCRLYVSDFSKRQEVLVA